jgi:hypothetical protein
MISKAVLLTVLLSAGMAGCQTPQGRWAPPPTNAPTQPSEGAICNVDVVVTSACVINVVDVLDTRRGPTAQTINWNLKAPAGYKFSDAPFELGNRDKGGKRPVQRRSVPRHQNHGALQAQNSANLPAPRVRHQYRTSGRTLPDEGSGVWE